MELEARPFICMLIPRMLFLPHTASLNGSAQFGTVESLEHILHSLFATVGTSRPHTRCIQPGAPSWAAGQRSPSHPRQANLDVQTARGSIPGPARDKAPRPVRGAHGWSARRLAGPQAMGMLRASKGQRGLPRPSLPWELLGSARIPCSCPSPLPLCNRLPELLTFRSPGHKARRVVVWRV